jgi:hypothetical protein
MKLSVKVLCLGKPLVHKVITLPLDAVNNTKRVSDVWMLFIAVAGPLRRVTLGLVVPLAF